MDYSEPDLTLQLPRDMYYQLVHTLRGSLPPPVTNSPEDEIRRDNAAISKVASLLPANGEEADLAPSSSPPAPRHWTACDWPGSTRRTHRAS